MGRGGGGDGVGGGEGEEGDKEGEEVGDVHRAGGLSLIGSVVRSAEIVLSKRDEEEAVRMFSRCCGESQHDIYSQQVPRQLYT